PLQLVSSSVRHLTCLLLLLGFVMPASAQETPVAIRDAATGAAVPFAAIRLGNSGQGVIADLHGAAVLPASLPDGFIEITALGYEPARISGPPEALILLKAKRESLAEFVVKPD